MKQNLIVVIFFQSKQEKQKTKTKQILFKVKKYSSKELVEM
jgi:hypothetical protein